ARARATTESRSAAAEAEKASSGAREVSTAASAWVWALAVPGFHSDAARIVKAIPPALSIPAPRGEFGHRFRRRGSGKERNRSAGVWGGGTVATLRAASHARLANSCHLVGLDAEAPL